MPKTSKEDQMAADAKTGKSSLVKYHKDGAIIEGVEVGGAVLTVTKDVQWIRDIGPYFTPTYLLIISHFVQYYTGSLLAPIWLMFLITPIVMMIGPGDNCNISTKSQTAWANDKRFFIPMYSYVFLENIQWLWALTICSDKINPDYAWFREQPQTWGEYGQFLFLTSLLGSIAGVIGHELLHNKQPFNKALGASCFTKYFYTHFYDEHLRGHHKTLGTPADPATAKKNQSIYSFILQSWFGSHVNVWKMETKRIQRTLGKDVPLSLIIFNNKMTMYACVHASMLFTIYMIFGWSSVKFQLAYVCTGMFFLEAINYIEHYGLERKKDKDGVYESIGKMHCWNSKSGPVFFRLQRHSDHHAHSFRPYQILRRFDDAPTLPFEYLHSIFLCIVPPLWYYLVDPKVEAVRAHCDGQKNIKTKYLQYMPMTKDDIVRQKVGWGALAALEIWLTWIVFG